MKRINREAIQRMVDARGGKAGGSANGGGGGGSLAGYATQAWVNEGFVSIEFFNRLFTVYGPGETSSDPDVVIEPNDLDSTIKNIKAMFGLWTEQYLSALGLNPGGTGSATSLNMLDDVYITTPTNGQALVYNSTSLKWENQTISTVTALANLTDVLLTSPADGQTLLYDGTNAKWYNSALKTINGQSLLGSGDISVGGGASGNYLPLSGGTLVGVLRINLSTTSNAWPLMMETANTGIYAGNTLGNGISIESKRNSSDYYLINCLYGQTTVGTGGTNAFTVRADGHVGIGTASPDYKLKVVGTETWLINVLTGNTGIWIGSQAGNGMSIESKQNSGSSSYYLLQCRYGQTTIGTGGSVAFTILTNGKVGIGTDAPDSQFHTTAESHLSAGAKFSYICVEVDNSISSTNRGGEINNYNFALNLQYDSNKNLTLCHGGGNTGVGTNAPSYKLHVNGTIYATGAITALSDIKQKNVEQYDAHLGFDEVANAPIIKFTWKDPKAEDKGLQVGSIAQYWEKVLPEAVKKDKEGTLSMSYGVVALVAAISTAKKVRELDERVTKLEKTER